MRRHVTASGPVDIETAWARYEHLDRWSDWAPQILAVDATRRHLEPGLRGIVRGPLAAAVPFEIDTVDPSSHSWSWTVTLLGVQVTMHHDLTATPIGDGMGTTAGLTVDGPAPIALTYGPVARIALARLCRTEV